MKRIQPSRGYVKAYSFQNELSGRKNAVSKVILFYRLLLLYLITCYKTAALKITLANCCHSDRLNSVDKCIKII